MKHTITLFTVLLLMPLATLHAADGFLVEQGRSRAEIVVAETPPRAVKLAATELQTYLEKITGSRLEIVTSPTGAMPVKIYVGESEHARRAGVDAEDLGRDAFRMVSGPDWLALVGRDWDFTPVEPWARSHTDWLKNKQAEWMKLAGHPWQNPVAASLYKDYSKQLDIWNFDHRGSLNAVYAFLRDLGVRWYMPGELGEIVPKSNTIALPEVNRTVRPEFEVRSVSRPLISSSVDRRRALVSAHRCKRAIRHPAPRPAQSHRTSGPARQPPGILRAVAQRKTRHRKRDRQRLSFVARVSSRKRSRMPG